MLEKSSLAALLASGLVSHWLLEVPLQVYHICTVVLFLSNMVQICDMFFQGERGKYIGFYALAITNGVCELSPTKPEVSPSADRIISHTLVQLRVVISP
jgi:hypothetical protein